MALVFADSFSPSDGSSVKWSNFTVFAGLYAGLTFSGGIAEVNPALVRTGPRSMAIRDATATIFNAFFSMNILDFALPPNYLANVPQQASPLAPQYSQFVVGIAFLPTILSGTLLEVWAAAGVDPAPPERQLGIVVNADGSLSLITGGGAVLGTSAAGVVSLGSFFYVQLKADLIAGTTTLRVTPDATGISTDVLVLAGIATSQTFVDAVYLIGPPDPDSFYVNDFYFSDTSDGSTFLGPVKIYAALPKADGTPIGLAGAAPFTPALPHFSLVNTAPFDPLGTSIDTDTNTLNAGTTNVETFLVDVSAIPPGSSVVAVHGTFISINLIELIDLGETNLFHYGFCYQDGGTVVPLTSPNVVIPDQLLEGQLGPNYYCAPQDLNPVTGLAWTLADWATMQFGPLMTGNGVQTFNAPVNVFQVAMELLTLAPAGAPLTFACGNPPVGVVGILYSHTFPSAGGTPPYAFAIIAGALPGGLLLDPLTGTVGGTPTLVGLFGFTVQITDSAAASIQIDCSIRILPSTFGPASIVKFTLRGVKRRRGCAPPAQEYTGKLRAPADEEYRVREVYKWPLE